MGIFKRKKDLLESFSGLQELKSLCSHARIDFDYEIIRKANFLTFLGTSKSFSLNDYMENGMIRLDRLPRIEIWISPERFCNKVICLPNSDIYFLKTTPWDYYCREGTEEFIGYNILIAQEIASALDIRHANYILVKGGKNMSLNFLKSDESLATGTILGDYVLFVDDVLKGIKSLRNKGKIDQEAYETIRRDYIKQVFFNKFIGNIDDCTRNFGFIVSSDGIIRQLAPAFDFDFSFNIYKKCENASEMVLYPGESSVGSVVRKFINEEWFREFIENFINTFNCNEILDRIESENPSFRDTDGARAYYEDFLSSQFNLVKSAYNRYYLKKVDMEI